MSSTYYTERSRKRAREDEVDSHDRRGHFSGDGERYRGGGGSHGPARGGYDTCDSGGRVEGGRGGVVGVRAGRGRPRQTLEDRRRERLDRHDLVVSREVDKYGEKMTKIGRTGKSTNFLANYFVLEKRTDWAIYHYRVDFLPAEKETRIKKKLFREHEGFFGAYIFDGSSLYLSYRLSPDVSLVSFIH